MNKKNIIIPALNTSIVLFILLCMIYKNPIFLFCGNMIVLIGVAGLLMKDFKNLLKYKYWIYIYYFIAVIPIWIIFFIMLFTIL